MTAADSPRSSRSPASAIVSDSPATHDPPRPPPDGPAAPTFTFWHYYLAAILKCRLQSPAIEVQSFVKLGALPLEADIILLRRCADVELRGLAPEFDFLVERLREYLVIEYKSSADRLTLADFDTVRAYAMLCKRTFGVLYDEAVAVMMLYSRLASDFFAGCARNGHPFVETEPGVWACRGQSVDYYAVDLVTYGARRPQNPINLFSARYKQYQPAAEGLGAFRSIYEEIFLKEYKRMAQTQPNHPLPEAEELKGWMKDWVDRVLPHMPAEWRVTGLTAEERLRGLSSEELVRLKALLEQSLKG